jgi:hypothetical protein
MRSRLGRGRRGVKVPRVGARCHLEEEGGVGHGAGQGPVAGQAVEGLGFGPGGDSTPLGLDPHQVGPGRGDPDRPSSVGSEGPGHQAGGHGHGGTARRPTRAVGQAPRVPGHPEGLPLREGPLAQLRAVGLAHHDGSRGPEASHHLGVGRRRREVPGTTEGGGLPGHVGVVLDRHRHPEQGKPLAGSESVVGLHCSLPGRVPTDDPEGVQRRLAGIDALQRSLDQVLRPDRPVGQPVGLLLERGERRLWLHPGATRPWR